jgi:glycosyltransferase involved in cell wall biosynthesis
LSGPLVSVIVPVYNRERFLAAALDSVFAQDYRPLEVIVVDDGSTDGTAAVARSYPEVRYLYQSNQGVAAARNAGVAASRGELLAFLDSDDLWASNKLSSQVGFLLAHPQVGLVLCHMDTFLEPGIERPAWIKPHLLEGANPANLPSALVVRRSVFERVGNFDAAYVVSEDVDWFARAKDLRIPLHFLPEALLHRRVHAGNLSQQVKLGQRYSLQALKASLDRQRSRPAEDKPG